MKKNKPYNPFLIAGYYSPDYFCNRETETQKIISALENDRNISLISPRRYGKTGLIQHVFHLLSEKESNSVCVYLDIYSTQNLNEFTILFVENILGKAEKGRENAMKKLTAFFKSFRPVLSYDSITGIPEISVKIDRETTENSLQEVFLYLKQLDKRCYIAIDEFQQVAEYPEKGTEALLRSYIQFLPNVKFIFAGSRQLLMSDIFLSAKRPFYQSTQIMLLGNIDKESYYQFAKNHFQHNGFSFARDCFDVLYNQFEGHTWYLQAVLNRLYEYRIDIGDTKDVTRAIQELLEENTFIYQELLNAFSAVQKNLLKAVAKEKAVMHIHAGDFVSKYNLKNVSSVNRALNSLLQMETIYKSEKGYIVYDRFLGMWLSRLK
jgi:hypothetical protein